MMKYVDDNNMVIGLPNWEIYLNEPDSVASEDELETDIYVTVSEA
jgi:effector-binding domain-containing protein